MSIQVHVAQNPKFAKLPEAKERERLERLKSNILGKVVEFEHDGYCVKGRVVGFKKKPARFIVEVLSTHEECVCRPTEFKGRIN